MSSVNKVFAQLPGAKYTIRQRFGVGMDQHIGQNAGRKIDEFPWQTLGFGWYFDWGAGQFDNGGPRENLEYMPLVGGYGPTTDPNFCTNIHLFSNGTVWTVGNEIGWDDNRTAMMYASDFIKWRDCLKSINPTYKIASGAIVSPWHALKTDTTPAGGCVDMYSQDTDSRSGKNYFLNYINRIKQIDPNKLPDAIVAHGYTHCNGGFTLAAFQQSVIETRTMMKTAGLQNRDLIIKEYSPLLNSLTMAYRQLYMSDTIDFILNYKDPTIGYFDDDYRLVQKFAWFVLNDWQGVPQFDYVALIDTYDGQILPLGITFQQKVQQYSKAGDVNFDDAVNIRDLRLEIVKPQDLFNYSRVVGNFGQ